MPLYTVNVTVSYPGWIHLEAEDADAALAEAHSLSARDFAIDDSGGEIEFDVTPQVEEDS